MAYAPKNFLAFYWLLTGLVIVLLSALAFLSWYALDAHQTNVADTLAHYQQFNTMLEYCTPFAFVVLLLTANYLFVRGWSSFYMWASLAVFIGFTLLDYLLIKDAYFAFKEAQGMKAAGRSIAKMMGGLIILLGGFITGVNYFIVKNLQSHQSRQKFSSASQDNQQSSNP